MVNYEKMGFKSVIFVIILLLLGCNEKVLTEQEKQYNQVADSLTKYKTELNPLTDEIRDFIELDYQGFRDKYKANNEDMNALIKALTVRYQLISANNSINNIFEVIDELKNELEQSKKTDSTTNDYTFNPKDFENLKELKNLSDEETRSLMEAYDKQKK